MPYRPSPRIDHDPPHTVDIDAGRWWQQRADEPGLDLRDYWRIIRRQLRLILVLVFVAELLTGLTVFIMRPSYTAESTVLIEPHAPQVLDVTELLSQSLGNNDYDYYKTQYEVLKSRALAARVIRNLNLQGEPLFTGRGQEQGFFSGLWSSLTSGIAEALSSIFSRPRPVRGDEGLGVDPGLIDQYLGSLDIKPQRGTRLVTVGFTTPDARLSARVTNAHVRAYIRRGMELHVQTGEEARRFLEEKLVDLKDRVEKSEAALNQYRRERGIVTSSLLDKNETIMARLTDLNKALTEAQAARIALEAEVRVARRGHYESLSAVTTSQLIQNLKTRLATVEGEYATLSSQFKPDYPPLADLRAKLLKTRRLVDREVRRIVRGIESSYQVAVGREKKLRQAVEDVKTRAMALNDASVQDAVLAREVDASRELYKSVLERMKEIGIATEVPTSNVSVVDKATPPERPSSPKKLQSLALSGLLALFCGVGVAFLLDYLDDRLKNPEEVEGYLRLASLGAIPDFASLEQGRYTPRRYLSSRSVKAMRRASEEPGSNGGLRRELVVAHDSLSVASDAYRQIRTSVLLSRAGEPPRTIIITSGEKAEGKTVTAVNMAWSFAQMGSRVLLIDTDLRRSRCHHVLGMENHVGLSEVLSGQIPPAEVIHPTEAKGLFFLSAGAVPPNPTELVGSAKMREILEQLATDYDYVLMDTSPVMPVSDTVVLSTMVDGILMVVGRKTPKQLVRDACGRLRHVGAKVLGVILNQIDLGSPDYYHYNRYYSYEYYRSDEKPDLRP